MSPSASSACSTTSSATSSMASVASPPGASPTLTRAAAVPRWGATASCTRAATASARSCGSMPVRELAADRDRGLVDGEVPLGEPRQRELADPLVTGVDERLAQVVGVEQAAQAGPQRLGVARRDEQRLVVGPG